MRPLTPDILEAELRAAIDAGDTTAIDMLGGLLDAYDQNRREVTAELGLSAVRPYVLASPLLPSCPDMGKSHA